MGKKQQDTPAQSSHTHNSSEPGYSVHTRWDNINKQNEVICDNCNQRIGILCG